MAVGDIIEVCYGCSERLDTSRRTIFTASQADRNSVRSFKAPFNVVVDFGCTLAKVGPCGWVIEKAMLLYARIRFKIYERRKGITAYICSLGRPHHTTILFGD